MRLGVISSLRGYRWAGSEQLWYACALEAIGRGHRVDLFLHPDVAKSEEVASLGAKGVCLQTWTEYRMPRIGPLREYLRPSFARTQLNRCDVLLVSLGAWTSACYTPGLIKSLHTSQVPFILLCQFNSDHLGISNSERAKISALLRCASACVFVSEQNLEVTRRQFAVEPTNSHVIHNCSRAALLDPLPWPELNDGLQMACVARHEILWKGQDLLMDVLRGEAWRQREWHLHFYGTGPDSEHLKNLTNFLGLKTKVSFKGQVSDLDSIWSRNHLLVLPSRGEGAPLAILEAMTYGRPVVCTDVGGNRELIEEGSTGFIAEAPNVRCLNMALERMWNAYPALKQMGIHAHQQAKKFNHVEPAKRLADLLSRFATEPVSNHCNRSNAQNFRCHPSV